MVPMFLGRGFFFLPFLPFLFRVFLDRTVTMFSQHFGQGNVLYNPKQLWCFAHVLSLDTEKLAGGNFNCAMLPSLTELDRIDVKDVFPKPRPVR